jgi:roadblock/LC7 domain-containing protein
MQSKMIAKFCPRCGIHPVRGWMVRGPEHTVCVMANVFCLLDNEQASIDDIMSFMRQAFANEDMSLI